MMQRLLQEQANMKAELGLLQRCLQAKGLLRDSDLHRQRFEDAKSRSRWTRSLDSLEQVMEAQPVAGNWPCWGQLRWACRSLHRNLSAVEKRPEECLYVVGGWDGGQPLASAERLHLGHGSGAWEPLPPMASARDGHAGAALAGSLYVCGGFCDRVPSNSVVKFSPAAPREGHWSGTVPMWEPRGWPVAVALRGRLYVCGGWDGTAVLDSLECLQPDRGGAWEQCPAIMARPRCAFSAVALRSQLFVFGGAGEFGGHPMKSAEAFLERSWRLLPPMEWACRNHAAVAFAGCALICSGTGHAGSELSVAQCYNPDTNTWFRGPSLPRPRSGHSAAVLAGRLFLLGGEVAQQDEVSSSVECHVLREGSWAASAPMAQRRTFFCCVALPSGDLEP